MKIKSRKIGKNFKPLIIAELGINHNGSLKKQNILLIELGKQEQK